MPNILCSRFDYHRAFQIMKKTIIISLYFFLLRGIVLCATQIYNNIGFEHSRTRFYFY